MAGKTIHIIGGGTISHVRPHLGLTAAAFGNTARTLQQLCRVRAKMHAVKLHLTRMANAGRGSLETNEHIAQLVDALVNDESTGMIFFNAALVDYHGFIMDAATRTRSGKDRARLDSRTNPQAMMQLERAPKVLRSVRAERKDIFLVAFKTTAGETENAQYVAGLNLLKESSANLVLANDVLTRVNMIVVPEEARYHVTTDRDQALRHLVDMACLRSGLTFQPTIMVDADAIPWESQLVPHEFRLVVNNCIDGGAYKARRGVTVGHFCVRSGLGEFLSSQRKRNHNHVAIHGLVRLRADKNGRLICEGPNKPSAGARSQYQVLLDHPTADFVIHFHCPLRKNPRDAIPVCEQRPFECGSIECGLNTSRNMQRFGNVWAVMLNEHGPNIVWSQKAEPQEVIDFIHANFDLSQKTGGPVDLTENWKVRCQTSTS